MHLRQKIREKFVEALTGLSTTGSHIEASRIYSIDNVILPCLSVYCGAEEYLEDSIQKGYKGLVNMDLHIDINVEGNSNFDDQLDEVLSEIQIAMSSERSNKQEGSLAMSTVRFMYQGCDEPEFKEGERIQASMRVNYLVQYEQNL